MVTRTTTHTFAIALAAALLAACASGTQVARAPSTHSVAVVRGAPAVPNFADKDADAFWDSIGDENFGFVETP